jgi:hypothetical protein
MVNSKDAKARRRPKLGGGRRQPADRHLTPALSPIEAEREGKGGEGRGERFDRYLTPARSAGEAEWEGLKQGTRSGETGGKSSDQRKET